MTARILIPLLLVSCLACNGRPRSAPRDEASFGPSTMRLHPVFTRLKDFDEDGRPDGIEAVLEFADAFGDPTKASGRVIFELFEFKPNQPDPRGRRIVNPWLGSLMTTEDQNDRWNRASRSYLFKLELRGAESLGDCVLAAQFDTADGRRYFDRLIIQSRRATTRPGD